MRIIARRTLKEFWEDPRYKDSEEALKAWYREVYSATWNTPQDIKNQYRNASILKSCVVVFNISGNKYRLVVKINYDVQIVYIKFVGTHREYDLIDMEEL
jgi:mRNA interferase HigB